MIKQANGVNITYIERKDEYIYNDLISSFVKDWLDNDKTNSNFLRVSLSDCEPNTIVKFVSGGLQGKIKKLIIIQCSDLKSVEMKMGDSKMYKGKIPTLFDELCRLLPKYRNVKVVIASPDYNKTSKIYKKIFESGKVILYERPTYRQFISFVNDRCKLYNIIMDRDTAKYLLSVIDDNFAVIDLELKKLSLLDSKDITKDVINESVVRSKKVIVFDLIHTMGTRRVSASMNLLSELLAQGTNGLQIIALLQRNFRILLYIHCKCDMSEFKLSKWNIKSYNEEAKHFKTHEVIRILSDLCIYEKLLKSSSIKEEFLFGLMIFEAL